MNICNVSLGSFLLKIAASWYGSYTNYVIIVRNVYESLPLIQQLLLK